MYPKEDIAAGGFTNPANTQPSVAAAPAGDVLSSSLLRVVIAEGLRVAPPVPTPQAAVTEPSTTTQASPNFDYERKILTELERREPSSNTNQNDLRKQDWYEATVSRCTADGISREDATLGLSVALALSSRIPDAAAVKQAAMNVRFLRESGLPKPAVVGALVARGGDAQAAVDLASI